MIIQRCGPDCSRQPVITGLPCESPTITTTRVNVTVQSASHSGPAPIKLCLNPGMICPVTGKSQESLGVFNSPVPAELCVCPVAVPTVTLGAERSMFTMGASAEKYMSVAPEYIIPVACMEDLYWIVVKAGLKLTVLVNGSLLDLLKLLVLFVPHRHKALLQPGGRLSLFFANS